MFYFIHLKIYIGDYKTNLHRGRGVPFLPLEPQKPGSSLLSRGKRANFADTSTNER